MKQLERIVVAGGLVISLAVAGCGGDGPPSGPCAEPFPSCTGSPVGSWVLDSVCGFKPRDCVGAWSKATGVRGQATLDLDAGGTGQLDWDLDFFYKTSIPLSCISSCAEMDDVIGRCEEAGTTCDCSGNVGLGRGATFGWETSAGGALLGPSDDPIGFVCVSDDVAWYHDPEDELFLLFRPNP